MPWLDFVCFETKVRQDGCPWADTHQDGNLAQARGGPGEAVSFGASAQTDIWDKYLGPFWDNPVETSAGAELSRGSLWLEYRAAEYADIIKV